jgi:plasmid replication initiation protein
LRAGGLRHVQPCAAQQAAADAGREQLDLFRALPGDMAPRDSQDLMAFPFFSLAKSRRTAPIDFRPAASRSAWRTQEHGIATIWDADVLIWAASQIVEARDAGLRPSRLMQATPYEILRFIGRGTSLRDYQRLKAAWIACNRPRWPRRSARRPGGACTLLVDQRVEGTGRCQGHAAGARADPAGLVLCRRAGCRPGADHRPGVFRLTGGIERWLYRLVRASTAARPVAGNSTSSTCTASRAAWRATTTSPPTCALVARQSLPGYQLGIEYVSFPRRC